jgi:hypothetical protein
MCRKFNRLRLIESTLKYKVSGKFRDGEKVFGKEGRFTQRVEGGFTQSGNERKARSAGKPKRFGNWRQASDIYAKPTIMKFYSTACLVVLLVVSFSCEAKKRGPAHGGPVSKATKSEGGISSRTSGDDLVDRLYREVVDSSDDLVRFEKTVANLGVEKHDSSADYDAYNETNEAYYHSAFVHARLIQDSSLKLRVVELVRKSQADYKILTARHQGLLAAIDGQMVAIHDSHELLKILVTLPPIQQYQRDELPSVRPLEDLSRRLRQVQDKLDSLTKKAGSY